MLKYLVALGTCLKSASRLTNVYKFMLKENCKRVCFYVSVVSCFIRNMSKVDGWYLAAGGNEGIMYVLLVNLISTFFLHNQFKTEVKSKNTTHILLTKNCGHACSFHKQIN